MAVLHIKNGGTKSSGTSTADDWSDANCYPITSLNTAFGAMSDGDTVIFDDDAFVMNAYTAISAPAGTVNISSRSGSTVWTPVDGSTRFFIQNDTVDTHDIVMSNITLDGGNISYTTECMLFSQHHGDITLNGVVWRNFSFENHTTTPPCIRVAGNDAQQTVTLTDCSVLGVRFTTTASDGLFKAENAAIDHIWNFNNLTISQYRFVTNDSGEAFGIIFHQSPTTMTIDGFHLDKVYIENQNSSGDIIGAYYQGASAVADIKNVTIKNAQLGGAGSTQSFFRFTGTATLEGVDAENMTRFGAESESSNGNSVGGVFQANVGADLTARDIEVRDSGGFFGIACYNTGGGVMTAENIRAINIDDNGQRNVSGGTMEGLCFYSGGDGDCTMNGLYAEGVTNNGKNGYVLYAHHADRTSDTTKTFNLNNVTLNISSADDVTEPALIQENYGAAATFTANLNNVIFATGNTHALTMRELQGGTLNVTFNSVHFSADDASTAYDSSGITNGSLTANSPTFGDPLLVDKVTTLSTLLNAGTKWWSAETRPLGADGNPLPDYKITVGGYQSKDADFDPRNL